MDAYYRDSRGRSVSAESIALEWMKANPEAVREALGRSPPPRREFNITAKAVGDGKARIGRAGDPDEAA